MGKKREREEDPEINQGTEGAVQKAWAVIIAGGGTGGHLFPGLAIGEEICRRRPHSKILFTTGRRKMETDILKRSGFLHSTIAVEGIKGRGWRGAAAVMLKLPFGLLQSFFLIKRFSPDLVLGVGGYSSGPVCLAAKIMGLPTAVQEQNSYPGLTNRLLCRWVDRVFISFEESRDHFPGGTFSLTGNPIRRELLSVIRPAKASEGELKVLVVGGSQGARAVNDAVLEAMAVLKGREKKVRLVHQAGEADFERIKAAYEKERIEVEVMPFIQDMAEAYGRADIVVGRAGASTVTELAALGLPSLLIPYPYAANNHQETNALMLERAGGARMIKQRDLSGERLAQILEEYMDDRVPLEAMGRNAGKMGRPNATEHIVDHLEGLVGRTKTGAGAKA